MKSMILLLKLALIELVCLELHSHETVIPQPVLGALSKLPVIDELNAEQSSPELRNEISLLASRKALGKEGIPAELLKYRKPHIFVVCNTFLGIMWKMHKCKSLLPGKSAKHPCTN